jgi:hypothetical protein
MNAETQTIIILTVFFLLAPLAFCLEGPDFMLVGDYYIPADNGFSITTVPYDKTGFSAVFRNCLLYGIGSLNWIYSGVKVYSQFGSAGVIFRDYGIKKLYSSTDFSFFLQKSLWRKISIGVGYSHIGYSYGDNVYQSFSDIVSFGAGWRLMDINIAISVGNLSLKRAGNEYSDKPEVIASCFWPAGEILSLYGAYYKDRINKSRFLIGQNLELIKPLIIKAGLLGGPEIYFVGMEIIYKRFVFGYTLFDIGRLPNCSRLTLSYR